jgi:hypothetical protein
VHLSAPRRSRQVSATPFHWHREPCCEDGHAARVCKESVGVHGQVETIIANIIERWLLQALYGVWVQQGGTILSTRNNDQVCGGAAGLH